jgi:hypothetical protein
MLKNNLKTAWRSLLRNKLQTGINIVGLAIGIAGCLSVFLLADYELSHNKTIIDADRIYRVTTEFTGEFKGVNSGVPTAVEEVAGTVVQGTDVQCFLHTYSATVEIPGELSSTAIKKFKTQKDLVVTGPEFFDLIQNFEWVVGAPRQSLGAPNQVVLTERKAKLYFGLKDPREAVGRTVVYNDSLYLTVAGILQDPTFRSDFVFNDFISAQTIPSSFLKNEFPQNEWGSVRSGDQFFIKVAEGVSKEVAAKMLLPLKERKMAYEEEDISTTEFVPQPLSDLHFNAELGIFDWSPAPAHKSTLYGLMLIAGLLLLIAAINFINLSTVQATQRSKEAGVRKVIGASRHQLTWQFLVETAVLTLLTIPVAMALSELAMRYFAEFLPEGLSIDFWSPQTIGFLVAAVVVVTFLAGLYPSFIMSSFHPAFAIKNQSGSGIGKNSSKLRKSLIVFQFVLAQAFIIGAMIIGQQMNFVLQKDLGFDQDSVVYFYTYGQPDAKKKIFLDRLQALPEVTAATLQNKPPIDRGYQTSVLTFERNSEQVKAEVHFRYVDTAFVRLYGIELLAGRNLLPTDTVSEFLINETLLRDLGYASPADAVGNTIKYGDKPIAIAGVVKNFHVRSLHHAIPPMALTADTRSAWAVAAKFSKNKPFAEVMEKMGGVWKEVYGDAEMHHFVLNETIEKLYESEARISKLINVATGLAILVSCLGLFGLAFFTVTQRSKEISIRKVLGATVTQVVGLLSKDMIALVVIALVIASPLAYYFMEKWLQDFAYAITIPWWIFVVAGFAAVTVAFLTVGFQSVKAALANPVESLRSE